MIDISDPAAPRRVGSLDTPGYGVAVAGTLVFVPGFFGLQILPTQCRTPNAVDVSALEAMPMRGAILITWRTSFESHHLGFHVHRSPGGTDAYHQLTSELIGPPGPYRFIDTDVSPGIDYLYRLEAVDTGGGSEFFTKSPSPPEAMPQKGRLPGWRCPFERKPRGSRAFSPGSASDQPQVSADLGDDFVSR